MVRDKISYEKLLFLAHFEKPSDLRAAQVEKFEILVKMLLHRLFFARFTKGG